MFSGLSMAYKKNLRTPLTNVIKVYGDLPQEIYLFSQFSSLMIENKQATIYGLSLYFIRNKYRCYFLKTKK